MESIRTGIVDKNGGNVLASVVQSILDPTKNGLVICNPDGSKIRNDVASIWGNITGTLYDQRDLQTALNNKLDDNTIGTINTVLHGNASGPISFGPVVENDISLSNNTTNNASLTKHGFMQQYPGGTTNFLRADGTFASITGTTVPNAYVSVGFTGTTYTLTHNFGAYPLVQCMDSTGAVEVPLSIINTSVNAVVITFTNSGIYTIIATLGTPPLSTITAVSANYAVNNNDYLIKVTASGKIITLPTAVGIGGKIFIVKNSSTGVCDVIGTGGQTIEGVADVTIASGDSYSFMSDGANYIVF